MKKKIKVFIIDDSAVVRQTLADILSSDAMIEVVGSAIDPIIAWNKMQQDYPDVILLDIEMPRMDGITFLKKLMSERPTPVVIISNFNSAGTDAVFQAMQSGAVEIIRKPRLGTKQFLKESKMLICDAVKAASQARLRKIEPGLRVVEPKGTADLILEKPLKRSVLQITDSVIVVGASTGCTEALPIFLESLPSDTPGVVVVLHMPEHYTATFAKRLDAIYPFTIKEAENNDPVNSGQVLIAPGNRHTLLKRNGKRYYVEVRDGPLVNRHRPSVDVLFRSAARYAGKNAIGVIMTGMGDDGAKGLREMKDSGAQTIAQDEASCVVFGMPQAAINLGAVDKIVSLYDMANVIMSILPQKKSSTAHTV